MWLLIFLGGGTVFFVGLSRAQNGNALVVGMELAYPPFEMTDRAGNPTGISVDLAHALGQHLSREVTIVNMPFDGLIPALKTCTIDVIISSMTATEERGKSVDFSTPYLQTGLAIFASADSTFTNAATLNHSDYTVAVKLGTTGHLYAGTNLPKCRILVLNEENACVLEVVQGKADAFIYDQMSVYKNFSKHPNTSRAILEPIKKEAWAIAIRKGNAGLLTAVNQFLYDFKVARGFDKLGDRHLEEMKSTFKELGYPFVF